MAKKVTKKKVVASKPVRKAGGAVKTAKKVKKTVQAAPKSVKKNAVATKKKSSAAKKTVKKTSRRPVAAVANDPPDAVSAKLKSYLTKSELEHFRTLLVDKLKQITGDVDHIEKEVLKMSRQDATGDLSSMPIHMADIGSDTYEQEFTLGLMVTERKIVQEILMALRRIEDGSYGMCEGTGEPIPKARLEAYPWARYCVRYAEMIEKGQVVEVRNNTYSSGRFASADLEDADDDEEDAVDDDDEAYEDDDEDRGFGDDDDDAYYN